MSYGRTQPSAGPVEGAIHGVAVYLGVTIASFLTVVLSRIAAGDESILVSGTEDNLYVAASTGLSQLLVLGPVLAIGLVIFYVASDRSDTAVVPAAVGAAVGTALSGLVLILLVVVVAPAVIEVDLVSELLVLGVVTASSVIAAVLSGIGFDLV